jgi:hypothetical protein
MKIYVTDKESGALTEEIENAVSMDGNKVVISTSDDFSFTRIYPDSVTLSETAPAKPKK